jgi:hypothetical protein
MHFANVRVAFGLGSIDSVAQSPLTLPFGVSRVQPEEITEPRQVI